MLLFPFLILRNNYCVHKIGISMIQYLTLQFTLFCGFRRPKIDQLWYQLQSMHIKRTCVYNQSNSFPTVTNFHHKCENWMATMVLIF